MTFAEAIETLSVAERQHVEEKFQILAQHTGVCLQAVTNIHSESRLPLEAWTALFEVLLQVGSESGAIRAVMTECFRGCTLCGPEVTIPHPKVFGRAVTADEFFRLLHKLYYFDTVEDAAREVQRMLWEPKEVVVERWVDFDLGRYLMWSTFSPETDIEDPFEGMPDSAEYIRGVLGLNRDEQGRQLLLLEYTLPADISPLFPTVAEAYAGDSWSYYFRPAQPDHLHGWTMPWDEYGSEKARPETVHKVIRGAQLNAPLRQVI
jgi:hypothetical protein